MSPDTPSPDAAELGRLRARVAALEAAQAEATTALRFLDAMDRVNRVMQLADDLDQLLEGVLDELLEMFGTDRAWLLFPCDPEAPAWRVPMERTHASWPGAFTLGVEIPMDPGAAGVFAEALATGEPLPFDARSGRRVPEEVAQAFHIRSQVAMVVRPRVGPPWLLGMHHCARDHDFTDEELRVFAGVCQRVGDALGALLLDRDLRESEQQRLHLQKMDAVGRLAGGVAHDFNNQLVVVLCYSDMAQDRIGDDPVLQQSIQRIRQAAERAQDLTAQLLAFSRRANLRPRALDLNEVVQSTSGMLRRIIGSHIDLGVSLDASPAVTRVDPHQLEQVLVNLVSNARDALADGGRVWISTRREVVSPGMGGPRPGTWVVLRVQDDGPGMDAAVRARIFEPYFTTKGRGGGTGLGLSTAFGVVQQSGGTITVDTAPGEGACFSVYLPAHDGPVEAPPPRPAAQGPAQGTERILLVEDDEDVAEAATQVLTAAGYRVSRARDARGALVRLTAGAVPELVLTDLELARRGGVDLLARVAADWPPVRVLCCSGSGEPAPLGGIAVLPKPYAAWQLLAYVRHALEQPLA